MTDTELYQIVKDHREAWPMGAGLVEGDEGRQFLVIDGDSSLCTTLLAFEASFHRALMKRGDVYTHHLMGTFTVQVGDNDFDAASLIEAYAKALEWLK